MSFFASDAQYENVNLALKLNLLDFPGWLRSVANLLFPGVTPDTPSSWSQPGSPGAYYEFGGLSHGIFGIFDTISPKKSEILRALGLDTEAGLNAAGITRAYIDNDACYDALIADPTILIDDLGCLRGFDEVKDACGNVIGHQLSPLGGAQTRIFFQYDAQNRPVRIAMVTSGSNSTTDNLKDEEADLTYCKKYNYLLKALEKTAEINGLTGHELGWLDNPCSWPAQQRTATNLRVRISQRYEA